MLGSDFLPLTGGLLETPHQTPKNDKVVNFYLRVGVSSKPSVRRRALVLTWLPYTSLPHSKIFISWICKWRCRREVAPLTCTFYLLTKVLLYIPASLSSVGLEALVYKEEMFPWEKTVFSLRWESRLAIRYLKLVYWMCISVILLQ
jgi:hypothetical protein